VDFYEFCNGPNDNMAAQDAWLDATDLATNSPALLDYYRTVYGSGVTSLPLQTRSDPMSMINFFWNSVPGRSSFNVTWATVRCALLGWQRSGALYAPIDDMQHDISLITRPMVERCMTGNCSNLSKCRDVPLGPLQANDAPLSRSDMRSIARSGMRKCIAIGLESFANFSLGATFQEGWSFGLDANIAYWVGAPGYPRPMYRFPGFFVRRDGNENRTAVPSNTWVEVMRIDRIDDKDNDSEQPDRATVGQVWFWYAPGSGIWWNTGNTLVYNITKDITVDVTIAESTRSCSAEWNLNTWWETRDEAFKEVTCKNAVDQGYDSMQLLASFCGFSHELVDCRGAARDDVDDTWSIACPPPHVPLMRGLPEARYAPSLVALSGPASSCQCSPHLSYLNCAGNLQQLQASQPLNAAASPGPG
jgi:hypothetical protein